MVSVRSLVLIKRDFGFRVLVGAGFLAIADDVVNFYKYLLSVCVVSDPSNDCDSSF